MLDLDFSDRVIDVIEEGFDAVVRFADAGDTRLMSRALGTYHRRLVAAPTYLAAKGAPLTPDDLKAHACLHHRFPTASGPVAVESASRSQAQSIRGLSRREPRPLRRRRSRQRDRFLGEVDLKRLVGEKTRA
jgi:hypothetical protein